MEEYFDLASRFSGGVLRVWYEDLCPDPDGGGEPGLGEIAKILSFLELDPADKYADMTCYLS